MSCFFSCHSFFPKCLPLTRVFFFTYAPGQIYSPFKLSSNTSSTWKTFPFWKHSLGLASCIIRVIFVSFIEHIIWLWFFKFMMFYLQDEYRYIVCQRMCVCVWESKRVNCGMCITWALSVSAKGLYITATVPLESYISCLVSHNHKIGLLRAWETLSKIYHTYAARSNYAYEVKPTEQWRNGWTTLDVNTHDPGMYCCIISC